MVDEYEVVAGDSYWGIAERFLPNGSADREVWDFTQALMAFNAPRLGYAHPALLHPGDVVDIVAPSAGPAAVQETSVPVVAADDVPSRIVVTGDSYWAIAEDTLGEDAAPREVLQLTNDLVDLNSPLLGYDERRMIHPGDVVLLAAPESVGSPSAYAGRAVRADQRGRRHRHRRPAACTGGTDDHRSAATDDHDHHVDHDNVDTAAAKCAGGTG